MDDVSDFMAKSLRSCRVLNFEPEFAQRQIVFNLFLYRFSFVLDCLEYLDSTVVVVSGDKDLAVHSFKQAVLSELEVQINDSNYLLRLQTDRSCSSA